MDNKPYLFVKRSFDILAALAGMILTLPIWLFAIIGIFFSDPGPIFYKAVRIGKNGREFNMWKFRSMTVPRKKSEQSEASFKADTARIFKFGALIRKLKIDELPQLLNILGGTMSVVGPRPAAKDQVEVMRSGKYRIASAVRPGLTSPAALYDYIYGDTVEDSNDYERLVLPTRLELEAYYPKHMSLVLDIKMIWYTVVSILYTIFGNNPEWMLDEFKNFAEIEISDDTGKSISHVIQEATK